MARVIKSANREHAAILRDHRSRSGAELPILPSWPKVDQVTRCEKTALVGVVNARKHRCILLAGPEWHGGGCQFDERPEAEDPECPHCYRTFPHLHARPPGYASKSVERAVKLWARRNTLTAERFIGAIIAELWLDIGEPTVAEQPKDTGDHRG